MCFRFVWVCFLRSCACLVARFTRMRCLYYCCCTLFVRLSPQLYSMPVVYPPPPSFFFCASLTPFRTPPAFFPCLLLPFAPSAIELLLLTCFWFIGIFWRDFSRPTTKSTTDNTFPTPLKQCPKVLEGGQQQLRVSPYTPASFARLLSHSLRFLKLGRSHTRTVSQSSPVKCRRGQNSLT